MATLKGAPVNALIRMCLLEERSGEESFNYNPPSGAPYTLKWSMHNGLDLVFVAVYQKALKLLYVEDLLKIVKRDFAPRFEQHGVHYDYAPEYTDIFKAHIKRLEQHAESQSKAQRAGKPQSQQRIQGTAKTAAANGQQDSSSDDEDDDDAGADAAGDQPSSEASAAADGNDTQQSTTDEDENTTNNNTTNNAFNTDLVKKLAAKRRPGAKGGDPSRGKKAGGAGKKRGARNWDDKKDAPQLDFSNDAAPGAAPTQPTVDYQQRSRVDVEDELPEEYAELLLEDAGEGSGDAPSGVLAGFVRSLGVNVLGTQALTAGDIAPALEAMKKKLMERNVAADIADKLCESVAASVVGQKLSSFTRVSTAVSTAFEAALTRILTPKRSIDVLRDVRASKAKGEPYVIVFVGVNGVGKSTNLAKVAYWLQQNDVSVMIAACDTFRSGAVEQLKTHCTRLGVPLYERGYEKDPAKVASEAVRAARDQKRDVVLVDTAGRMQDNEPLMRALSNLININRPNLVLFVGEALVGNDAVDQLTKFNQRLADLASTPSPHTIDGIVLTKFDTIDDKVGAALSMVYTSGAPIMFVGCGQTYVDLKKLNVKHVVQCLLK